MLSATVYSPYGSNIHPDIPLFQKQVVNKLLPKGWGFEQYQPKNWENHPSALSYCQHNNTRPITIFLDIDCIPLKQGALECMTEQVENGTLFGAVQRSNHIQNNEHLYVGPFCMAFLNSQYKTLGSPSFFETSRGDCAEELTYRWEELKSPVEFIWPSHVEHPCWLLKDNIMFGQGTTYGNLFYHAFESRNGEVIPSFINKCKEVINE